MISPLTRRGKNCSQISGFGDLVAVGLVVAGLLVPAPAPAQEEVSGNEDLLLANVRQLTFEGRRAGEGYFSRDGAMMVFQSEREPGNPFYQIYLLDLETGEVRRLSPGIGKTTCAWIHPSGRRALFASTHEDLEAVAKQEDELALRAAGKERRYAWSFDEQYDIFETDLGAGWFRNLTKARGYDAEGSWSPDGKLIAFASNRHAYTGNLSADERKRFEIDKSFLMDIYVMNADGSGLLRLTRTRGYDGGPFFSPNGQRIIWRRFSEDGATAEVFTMDVDGGDEKRITDLGEMSWAPYFHPSGAYVIFATNKHGFANFELYLVDSEGGSAPIRVTGTEGFDGLPTFSPDGKTLSWTSTRGADKSAQIFLAEWNHEQALALLGLKTPSGVVEAADSAAAGWGPSRPEITPEDMRRHIAALASAAMDGRLTGTPGERLATDYVAEAFANVGLAPAGDDGGYFQTVEFTAGARLGPDNRLGVPTGAGPALESPTVDRDWRPLAFSRVGSVAPAGVVFAGYGIVAPDADEAEAYDSYRGLDVRDKWVLIFRYLPEGVSQPVRQHLFRYANLRFKAIAARDRGARGLIVVSGPNAQVEEELIPLAAGPGMAAAGIAAITVTDAVAAALVEAAGKSLASLQEALDSGEPVDGFALSDVEIGAEIDVVQVSQQGRNVIARLAASDPAHPEPMVVIGAHVDHLGHGTGGDSLARKDEMGQVHFGADDNASGVAGLIEIAEYLVDRKRRGRFTPRRDILFAAWSGEELGMLGAGHFVRQWDDGGESGPLASAVLAYLNMDMIGRLDTTLALQGVGSSPIWRAEIERANVPVGLSVLAVADSYLPTDATTFYLKEIPILNAFTGVHGDYHTPRDTADKINLVGAAKVARLMGLITRSLALREGSVEYVRVKDAPEIGRQRTSRVYLGTIPDYAAAGGGGVRISGVTTGGPAENAGVEEGDVVVELAGRKIENIHDYSYALDALKIGQPADLVVIRGGKSVTLEITPASRD